MGRGWPTGWGAGSQGGSGFLGGRAWRYSEGQQTGGVRAQVTWKERTLQDQRRDDRPQGTRPLAKEKEERTIIRMCIIVPGPRRARPAGEAQGGLGDSGMSPYMPGDQGHGRSADRGCNGQESTSGDPGRWRVKASFTIPVMAKSERFILGCQKSLHERPPRGSVTCLWGIPQL